MINSDLSYNICELGFNQEQFAQTLTRNHEIDLNRNN
jgi:hypothetical protein